MNHEKQAVRKLRLSWPEIPESHIESLELFFVQLRAVDGETARLSPHELHESLWGILGILSRCYQLLLCSIKQVGDRNLNGFYVAARGLVETLCSVVWVNEKPERLCNLVQLESLRIGRIMNSGYRKYPNLNTVYSNMSSIVHPNRTSQSLGPRSMEEVKDNGVFGPFSLNFSAGFAQKMIDDLINLISLIISELETVISGGEDVVRGGRLMVRVRNRMQDEA